jgi:colicin import membrane protein
MKLPLGGAMEEELDTRQKKLYVYDVKPEDQIVDFEFTVVAPGDLPIGVFFTRKGGDVSYPLEGWAMSKYDMKDGTKRGCCEIASVGSIALVLDNSSSRLKTKTVKFAVQSRATTKQYEMDKKLAEMKATQDRRAAAAREEKLGQTSSPGAGRAARQGGPPKPRTPKPTKPKPVSSAAAAAAAYEAAEAEAEAAALFRGSVTGDLPSPGSPGSSGGIKRRAKKKRPAKAADAARLPAAVDSNAPMDLEFIADAEAARKQQADIAAAKRKAKQEAALNAKKELQKEDMKRKAAAKAKARQSAKAQAEEKAKRKAEEEERDRKEELRFQKQKEAQEQSRKAREEMEAEAQAALERARAAAEERRQAQAKAREEVVREKEAKKAARLQAAEEARNQAAAKKAEERVAKEELRKQREAEEAMKIEMYDQSGKVLRRLGRYTVQEENGYVRGWVCDICLQIKAGTFYFATSTVQGEEDPFRACARCLIDGDVIDLTDDLVFGSPGASIGDIKAADAGSSDDEAEAGGADEGAQAAAAKLLAKNRAIWAGEAVDGAELDAMSISATLSEAKMEKDAAKDDSLMTVYIRPGQWLGGSIGDGGKWVQDDRFSVRVPRTATWSELVTAVAASDQARDYSVTGGELDGAAEVPLDGAHPDLAAVNFFTGKTKKRIVSASEYANFPVPFPGQKAEVAKYGVLTRSQVIAGDAAMG